MNGNEANNVRLYQETVIPLVPILIIAAIVILLIIIAIVVAVVLHKRRKRKRMERLDETMTGEAYSHEPQERGLLE